MSEPAPGSSTEGGRGRASSPRGLSAEEYRAVFDAAPDGSDFPAEISLSPTTVRALERFFPCGRLRVRVRNLLRADPAEVLDLVTGDSRPTRLFTPHPTRRS